MLLLVSKLNGLKTRQIPNISIRESPLNQLKTYNINLPGKLKRVLARTKKQSLAQKNEIEIPP